MIGTKAVGRLLCAMLCLMLFAQAAEARRFRFFGLPHFGSSSSETIDRVYDLPNEAPFVKDGEFLDIGYLNSPHGNSYVLYHDDRFRRLSDEDIALFTSVLGVDPTAEHRARQAAEHPEEAAERAHHDDMIARGQMIEPKPGETSAQYSARRDAFIASHRSSGNSQAGASDAPTPPSERGRIGGFGIGMALLVLFVLAVAGRRLFRGVFGLARVVADQMPVERTGAADEVDHRSFDERVSRRLAELQGGGGSSDGADPGHVAPPAPVRGFGRKTA